MRVTAAMKRGRSQTVTALIGSSFPSDHARLTMSSLNDMSDVVVVAVLTTLTAASELVITTALTDGSDAAHESMAKVAATERSTTISGDVPKLTSVARWTIPATPCASTQLSSHQQKREADL